MQNHPIDNQAGVRIEARNVARRFVTPTGVIDAVRDLSLMIDPGQFCVVVGPSGCGKSTFLRMVAGLDAPTSGELTIARTDGAPASNAVVFQGRSLFPWLTICDNVAYGLKVRGVDRDSRNRIADEQLTMLGLGPFAEFYPHQVSEGMRQRVAIGRALAVDPDLLLMDEPFGALDEQTRFILQEEVLRIQEERRKTVVFITHSIDEAIVLADRIVVMTAQPGSVRAVIDVPLSRPRSLMDVRTNPVSSDLFAHTWDLLRDEVMRARQAQERELAG